MTKGWNAAIAACLAILLLAGLRPAALVATQACLSQEPRRGQRQAEGDQREGAVAQRAAPSAGFVGAVCGLFGEVEPSPAPDGEKRNPELPKWTDKAQAWSALAVALLTMVLLVINGRQVRLLVRSTRAAERAAAAAADAVALERAWVTPDGFAEGTASNITIDGVSHAAGHVIALRWKNTGRSPAVRVDIFVDQAFMPPNDPVPVFTPAPPPGDRAGIFGPGAGGSAMMQGVGGVRFEEVKQRQLTWILYSRVTYGITSDPESAHHTEACVRVEYNGERWHDGQLVPNVSITPVGAQNTAT